MGVLLAKAKNVPTAKKAREGADDIWTWTAIDAEAKLMPSWFVGGRDAVAAHTFMRDLADRLTNRVQLPTDGNKAYLDAVERASAVRFLLPNPDDATEVWGYYTLSCGNIRTESVGRSDRDRIGKTISVPMALIGFIWVGTTAHPPTRRSADYRRSPARATQ